MALYRMIELEYEAQRCCLRWPDYKAVLDQAIDECKEIQKSIEAGDRPDKVQEEIGDLLRATVSLCLFLDFSLDDTIRKANAKFTKRLMMLQIIAEGRGLKSLKGQSLDLVMDLWNEVKIMEAYEDV